MDYERNPVVNGQYFVADESASYCKQEDIQANCHHYEVGHVNSNTILESTTNFQNQFTSFKPRKKRLTIEKVDGREANSHRILKVKVKLKTI